MKIISLRRNVVLGTFIVLITKLIFWPSTPTFPNYSRYATLGYKRKGDERYAIKFKSLFNQKYMI